jgi:hypothetical protein
MFRAGGMVCVIQDMMFGLGLCLSGWKGIGEDLRWC